MFLLSNKNFMISKEGSFMKEYKFKSVFAPHINSFLRMKEAMGFGLVGFKIKLKEFDLFFIENNVTDLSITKSLISEWSKTRVNDSRRTLYLSLIHISEPTRRTPISYAVFCLKKKKKKTYI